MTISEKIKHERTSREWSQCNLAFKIGTTPQTISNWESGSAPSSSWIPRLAKAFGITVGELYEEVEAEAKTS